MRDVPSNAGSARVRDHGRLGGQHPLRILVAEDNEVNEIVIVRILENLGYRAHVATNGAEVLAALERQPYDVILMDMQMPGMDGLTATREIRAQEAHQGLQIIAVTANATSGARRSCMDSGMNDYISKPVLPRRLVKALVSAAQRIEKARAQQAQQAGVGTETVLLVDDDNMTRVVYSRCLELAGFDVVTADSGAAALSLLEERSFDVMLLDNVMPELTGIELLEMLSSKSLPSRPRVVMLAGTDDPLVTARCKTLGVDDVLVKPVPPGQLRAVVRGAGAGVAPAE